MTQELGVTIPIRYFFSYTSYSVLFICLFLFFESLRVVITRDAAELDGNSIVTSQLASRQPVKHIMAISFYTSILFFPIFILQNMDSTYTTPYLFFFMYVWVFGGASNWRRPSTGGSQTGTQMHTHIQ